MREREGGERGGERERERERERENATMRQYKDRQTGREGGKDSGRTKTNIFFRNANPITVFNHYTASEPLSMQIVLNLV